MAGQVRLGDMFAGQQNHVRAIAPCIPKGPVPKGPVFVCTSGPSQERKSLRTMYL